MGLFKKDNCCLCGEKAGLLDKKCIDGKVCKDCRDKLSVWFDDYKNSTALDLRTQTERKKEDDARAKTLDFSRIFGEFGVILIDERAKVFTAFADTSSSLFGERKAVSSIDDVIKLHPDLISFDQVKDIEIDITETSREEKRTVDGQQVSYEPQRWLYMYSFTLRLTVDHPYIKSVYIPLNKGTVQIKNVGRRLWTDPGRKLAAHVLGLPELVKEDCAVIFDNETLMHRLFRSDYEMPDYSYGFKCTHENWSSIMEYQYYLAMAREIERIITEK